MENQTLRQYFCKHPDFKPGGDVEVVSDSVMKYCGVPITNDIWKMLKAGKLDYRLPDHVVREVEAYKR